MENMNEQDLIEIAKVEDQGPTGFVFTIFEMADGNYIKKCEYNGQVEWIRTGHGADFTYQDDDKTFQKVFRLSEAMEYGYKVPCNYTDYIDPYKNLSCDPNGLKLIEEIYFTPLDISDYERADLFECPNCKKRWKIKKYMDSQRGMTITCIHIRGDS